MREFTLDEGGFKVADYVVFFILCTVSCIGGIFYSAKASRKEVVVDLRDYLLGGQTMSTFPVSMSLIASYVSGVTILGTPTEIFNYGTQYYLIVVGIMLSCVTVAVVYMPVFHKLKVHSSYEYLELRFNRHVRAVASILFLIDEILFLPMVVYVPALAFNQLTGFNVYAVGGVMVLICGLYTVLGGLRAVVWTDSVQTIFMYVGVITITIAGTVAAGGFKAIFDTARRDDRFRFDDWRFSPYERQTGWGAVVGGFLYWTCFNSVNQTMVQRYLSIPTRRKATHALAIFCGGAVLAVTLCVWCGLAAWNAWVTTGCSPTGIPPVNDRLLPAYVTYISVTQKLPGLSGIFLAGVFGAGLSSLSAVLNACALVALEDLMRGWLRVELRPLMEGIIARVVTAVLAIISVVMLIVISKLGGVLGVATALSAIAASTTCGIFTLGMVCWWVGPRGAIVGACAGAIMAGTVALGTQTAAAKGLRYPPTPYTSCSNSTIMLHQVTLLATSVPAFPAFPVEMPDPETVFPLFRISYHWIAPLGLLTTLSVGAIAGYLLDNKANRKLDAELFTPLVWKMLPEEAITNAGRYRIRQATREEQRAARWSHSKDANKSELTAQLNINR